MADTETNPETTRKFKRRFFLKRPPQVSVPAEVNNSAQVEKSSVIELTSENGLSDLAFALITEQVATLGEVNKAFRCLKASCESSIYESDPKAVPTKTTGDTLYDPEEQIYQQLAEKIARELKENGLTAQNFRALFEGLRSKIEKSNKLIVYLAFVADKRQQSELVATAKLSIHEKFMIDFKYDPDLVAGCAFVWKGQYRDYSLRQRIRANQEPLRQALASFNQSNH